MFATRKRNRRKTTEDSERWWSGLSLAGLGPLFAHGLRPVLAMSGSIIAAALLLWGAMNVLDRPIATVEVGGQFQRVAPVQIEAAVAPFRGAGFLSVDLDAMQHSLEKIAWVDRARVERHWPRSVRVVITEHVAAARWGEDGLMNTRGELFLAHAERVPPELPQLIGPDGTQAEVAKLYLESYPQLLAVGMRLSKVELDPRGAWQLTLSNGVQVRLGRQDVQERLQRFLRVASPLVASRSTEVSYVDLRYSNGFSVGWIASGTRMAQDAQGVPPGA
jgi:cell division protein FtsQ